MTDLDVANRALILLGVETVGSLADNSKAARVMAMLLPETKKVVLNEFPWTFTMRIAPLSQSSSTPPVGYARTFNYPAQALNVQRVYDSYYELADYRVLGNIIAANIESGAVEYMAYVDDVNIWPHSIIECLVTHLASDAAMALNGSPQFAIALLQKYTILSRGASQNAVVEENIPPARALDYTTLRG